MSNTKGADVWGSSIGHMNLLWQNKLHPKSLVLLFSYIRFKIPLGWSRLSLKTEIRLMKNDKNF